MRVNIWPKEQQWLVTNRFDGKKRFLCDVHIAEAIKTFNQKGYCTCNCCEGHPYKEIKADGEEVSDSMLKKWNKETYFNGGYLCFCSEEDMKLILSKLSEKGDYFFNNGRPGNAGIIRWECINGIFIDGKKHSSMKFSSMEYIMRLICEDIWNIIREVADELPYKENRNG